MKHKKTVLITGGAGYIGSHLSYFLAHHNYKVVLLDDLSKGTMLQQPWATFFKADYADVDVLEKIFQEFKVEAVVHCASFTSVPESIQNPLNYYQNNVAKTVTLLEMMVKHHIKKIVFSSSCAVYGNPQIIPLTEQHPLNPMSPYGHTKLMVEQLLQSCQAAHQLEFVSLRYFNVAGTIVGSGLNNGWQTQTNVIPLLLRAVTLGAPFTVFGTDYQTPDGTCVRDYIHVQDIADAHYKALLHLDQNKPSDCFNIGSGRGWSVKELIAAAQKITKKEIEIIQAPRREGDPVFLVADATKAADILNWRPCYSHLEYCLETVWQS
jgi:UDP-glucose 4-epimerase